MSRNLCYEDLWHDLYDYLKGQVSKATGESLYENIVFIMEEMDPRLDGSENEEDDM